MRILFLSRWFPYPPDNGSKIRIFNILRQLSQLHEVGLVSFRDSNDRAGTGSQLALREHCSVVRSVPLQSFRPASAKALLGLFSRQPRYMVDTYSEEMLGVVMAELRRQEYDLVVASELNMVPYALAVPGIPALLDEIELAVFADATQKGAPLRRLRGLLTWWKLAAYLRRALPRFAACTVVSEEERELLRRAAPAYADVAVIPNAVDASSYDGHFAPPQPNTLVFSGALTYSANYDAMRYFLKEIYPAIIRATPDVQLRVTGDHTGVDLASLGRHQGVQYTGYVADVRPVVAQSWASVVPLRLGGGTRLKILESLALGTPVVATAKGAEGLAVTDGENILIAPDPASFAGRVTALLRSRELRERLAASGRDLVSSRYDWRVIGKELCALVEEVAARRRPGEAGRTSRREARRTPGDGREGTAGDTFLPA